MAGSGRITADTQAALLFARFRCQLYDILPWPHAYGHLLVEMDTRHANQLSAYCSPDTLLILPSSKGWQLIFVVIAQAYKLISWTSRMWQRLPTTQLTVRQCCSSHCPDISCIVCFHSQIHEAPDASSWHWASSMEISCEPFAPQDPWQNCISQRASR